VANYSEMMAELEGELSRAMDERERVEARIDTLLTAIESVKSLAEESDEEVIQPPSAPEAGFTEKVRAVLNLNMAKSFTPVEIRDVLIDNERDADPKVMLIHIHNTVKRLRRQGEVEIVMRPDGNRGYRAKSIMAKDAMDRIKRGMIPPSQIGAATGCAIVIGKDKPHGFVPMNTPGTEVGGSEKPLKK
jgi:hypothetical protein